MIPDSALESWKLWNPPADSTGALPFPTEVVLMISDYLNSVSLVYFFCTSAANMRFAPLYCRYHRWHLFPSIYSRSTSQDIQGVIGAIAHTFPGINFLHLTTGGGCFLRWKIFQTYSIQSPMNPQHQPEIRAILLRQSRIVMVSIASLLTFLMMLPLLTFILESLETAFTFVASAGALHQESPWSVLQLRERLPSVLRSPGFTSSLTH